MVTKHWVNWDDIQPNKQRSNGQHLGSVSMHKTTKTAKVANSSSVFTYHSPHRQLLRACQMKPLYTVVANTIKKVQWSCCPWQSSSLIWPSSLILCSIDLRCPWCIDLHHWSSSSLMHWSSSSLIPINTREAYELAVPTERDLLL